MARKGRVSAGDLIVSSGSTIELGARIFNSKSSISNKRSIGNFTEALVIAGKSNSAVAKGIYYFVPKGKAAGSGRLSAGMAQCASIWVQSVLTGRRIGKDGLKEKFDRYTRYDGPQIKSYRSDAYQDWINEESSFKIKDTVSYLTGRMAAAIHPVRSTGGGYAVGINRTSFVKTPVILSKPLRYSKKKVAIATYAAWQEEGTDYYPARPWISGAMIAWIRTFDTVWADVMTDMLINAYWSMEEDIGIGTKGATEYSTRHTPMGEAATAVAATQAQAVEARSSGDALLRAAMAVRKAGDGLHKSVQAALGKDAKFEGEVLELFKKGLMEQTGGKLKDYEIAIVIEAIKNGMPLAALQQALNE